MLLDLRIHRLFKNKKTKDKLFLVFINYLILFYIIGCAKGNFERLAQTKCNSDTGACSFDETIYISGGMVDILFVNDNSGSMSFEQSKMGERFPMMLEKLDDRLLNYRIGITTTDIGTSQNLARSINQNGLLQNGRLISFSNGKKFLEPNTPSKNELFLTTMKRPETLECEQYITSSHQAGLTQSSSEYQKGYYEHCPSGDERGIMAALFTIKYNSDQMIRPKSHLAVVIISDENERSWGLTDPQASYVLSEDDKPQAVINAVKQNYADKTLSVHSIVVRSNDSACLQVQNNQMNGLVKGFYGSLYEELSLSTNGVIGSVCEADYGDQMGKIGAAIVEKVNYFTLHCESPENLEIKYVQNNSPITYRLEGKRVIFDSQLDPSSKVQFKYNCPLVD